MAAKKKVTKKAAAKKKKTAAKNAAPANKKLGAEVDKLMKLKAEVDKTEAAHNKAKKALEEQKDKMLKTFKKEEIDGASGKNGRVSLVKKQVPQIENYDQLVKYIARTKSFDLFQRRINSGAYRERIEAGKKIPGVKTFEVLSLRVSKRK